MPTSREELFNRAKENRAAEKAKEASRGTGGWTQGDYEFPTYAALTPNRDFVARLLGNPISVRETPFDAKEVMVSSIRFVENAKTLEELTSSAKRTTFKCIWKPKNEDEKDWIMWRVQQKLMEYKWNKDTRQRDYIHKGTAIGPLFNEVAFNGRPDNKYETGWYPKTHVVMNIIDRQDLAWHLEHKKTKLLSSKVSVYENDKKEQVAYFDTGIPRKLYSSIWDDIVEYNGDWENYDVVLRKVEDDPWYHAFHSIDDAKKIQAEAKQFIVAGPLTDEERGWARYNLDESFPITSYLKIFNKIGHYFKLIDKFLDTEFYKELEEYAEADKKRYAEEKKREEEAKKVAGADVSKPAEAAPAAPAAQTPALTQTAAPATAPAAAAPTRAPAPTREARSPAPSGINWDALADGSFNGTQYLGVPLMTDDEKAQVVKVNEDGSFEYLAEWQGNPVQLYECKSNKFMSPGTFHVDPLSGAVFQS